MMQSTSISLILIFLATTSLSKTETFAFLNSSRRSPKTTATLSNEITMSPRSNNSMGSQARLDIDSKTNNLPKGSLSNPSLNRRKSSPLFVSDISPGGDSSDTTNGSKFSKWKDLIQKNLQLGLHPLRTRLYHPPHHHHSPSPLRNGRISGSIGMDPRIRSQYCPLFRPSRGWSHGYNELHDSTQTPYVHFWVYWVEHDLRREWRP
mmetsp:Transcript_10419/g.15258  ORF Transcript_10419/g.15258 Transcript_10419/m.15258 type:complete len:206 (+) Transcript_10419:101-718(+)